MYCVVVYVFLLVFYECDVVVGVDCCDECEWYVVGVFGYFWWICEVVVCDDVLVCCDCEIDVGEVVVGCIRCWYVEDDL